MNDVDDVKYVINFDFPNNTEDYIHRIGRTGRSTNKGTSYTFFTPANGAKAGDLIGVLREANQFVNPELEQYARSGGRNRGGGRGRYGGGGGGRQMRNDGKGRRGDDYRSGNGDDRGPKFARRDDYGSGNRNDYGSRNGFGGDRDGPRGGGFGGNKDRDGGFKSNGYSGSNDRGGYGSRDTAKVGSGFGSSSDKSGAYGASNESRSSGYTSRQNGTSAGTFSGGSVPLPNFSKPPPSFAAAPPTGGFTAPPPSRRPEERQRPPLASTVGSSYGSMSTASSYQSTNQFPSSQSRPYGSRPNVPSAVGSGV